MNEYVWITEKATGHQYPFNADEAKALGDAVSIDTKHPTHDPGGELLHPVYKTTVAAAAEAKRGRAASDKEN